MNKVIIIIQREFYTRVKNKTFIIMTFVGPLLMAALFLVPVFMASLNKEEKTIAVVDESGLFINKLPQKEDLRFEYLHMTIAEARNRFSSLDYDALLFIPPLKNFREHDSIFLVSDKLPGIGIVGMIERTMEGEMKSQLLSGAGIDQKILDDVQGTRINIHTKKITAEGEESGSSGAGTAAGYIAGILIYIFVFMYGVQVLRGVMEEKTNRIVEVIVSSVRPFQLMMGKIIGIAMVGLLQFIVWVLLTIGIITTASTLILKDKDMQQVSQEMAEQRSMSVAGETRMAGSEAASNTSELLTAIKTLPIGLMIGSFLFYFLGGYLLYSSLFAAIGAAVDSETDTQQFMLPVTIPLILSMIVSQFVIQNPSGPVAFWFSMIPLTSPVTMMIRIPFDVPVTELITSMLLLVAGFLGTTWLAAKIYRTGILMYGKKVTYRELWKWLFYKG